MRLPIYQEVYVSAAIVRWVRGTSKRFGGPFVHVLHFITLLFLPFFLESSTVLAEEFRDIVIAVLDGDTLEVLHDHHAERIRLNGIDCPEKGQPYGKRAKQAASALVFGKHVTLNTRGLDKYGRTIADVILPDGTKVNQELVKAGWCWWYRKYAPTDVELEKLEKEAWEAKEGLWVDPAPVPPWEWRKR